MDQENSLETLKQVDLKNDYKPKFSWAYGLWGFLGYFFHRNQLNTSGPWYKFWQCPAYDTFLWMLIPGIFVRLLDGISSIFLQGWLYVLSFLMIFLVSVFCYGKMGVWRFNQWSVKPVDKRVFKHREKVALISGIIFHLIWWLLVGVGVYAEETNTF